MPSRTVVTAAIAAMLALASNGCAGGGGSKATNVPWLGCAPPGTTAAIFAPGIVSTGASERDIAMMPDGSEIYFGRIVGPYAYSAIMQTRLVDGVWSKPEVAPFSRDPGHLDLEPCISPDGSRFFFLSTRPDTSAGETEAGDQDIWVMDRVADGWSEPRNLGLPVNTSGAEFFPSVTNDGTLYFNRREQGARVEYIMRSRFVDGEYAEPEILPAEVNAGDDRFNAFIAPDESYIIVCVVGREDNLGGADYYVSFRGANDSWRGPFNLGARVNAATGREWSPFVSRDGRYLFFMSSRTTEKPDGGRLNAAFLEQAQGRPGNGNADIWWIDAAVIEDLRPTPDDR
ncbi:MAG: PD40 domain-containing protein [Candidatus Krumholzibacteriota bacterium]|nr:PD40 domain-containing protein [Candidatus Krumholzibacteriota bacterium]